MWFGNAPPPPAEDAPVGAWSLRAQAARNAGRFEEAIALYKKILAASAEQFPSYDTNPINGPDVLNDTRRNYRVALIETLLAAHQLDAARSEVAAFRATFGDAPDLTSPADTLVREQYRTAALAVVRSLIADHQLEQARAALATLAKDRPDVALLSDSPLVFQRGAGRRSTTLRELHQSAWLEYDTVWWELQDVLRTAK
jgi:tetratricopeptide (TPR) repeat protein